MSPTCFSKHEGCSFTQCPSSDQKHGQPCSEDHIFSSVLLPQHRTMNSFLVPLAPGSSRAAVPSRRELPVAVTQFIFSFLCLHTLPLNAKCDQQLGLWGWNKSLWTAPHIVIYPSDHPEAYQDGFTITSRARIKALNSIDTTSALSVLPPLPLFCLILDSLASTFPAQHIYSQNIWATSGTWTRHNWKSAGVPTRL